MTRYKIQAKSVTGNILVYNIEKYSIIDEFVTFLDIRTGETKRFHSSNCEITEVKE